MTENQKLPPGVWVVHNVANPPLLFHSENEARNAAKERGGGHVLTYYHFQRIPGRSHLLRLMAEISKLTQVVGRGRAMEDQMRRVMGALQRAWEIEIEAAKGSGEDRTNPETAPQE